MAGEEVVLPCEVTGDPRPEVEWKKDSFKIDFFNMEHKYFMKGLGSLVIPKVDIRDTARYLCIAENAAGVVTQEINLIVHGGKKILLIFYTLEPHYNTDFGVHREISVITLLFPYSLSSINGYQLTSGLGWDTMCINAPQHRPINLWGLCSTVSLRRSSRGYLSIFTLLNCNICIGISGFIYLYAFDWMCFLHGIITPCNISLKAIVNILIRMLLHCFFYRATHHSGGRRNWIRHHCKQPYYTSLLS